MKNNVEDDLEYALSIWHELNLEKQSFCDGCPGMYEKFIDSAWGNKKSCERSTCDPEFGPCLKEDKYHRLTERMGNVKIIVKDKATYLGLDHEYMF
jgi:hypothetical protein